MPTITNKNLTTQDLLIDSISHKGRQIADVRTDYSAIPDGVLDYNAYVHSSPKIAWILKEPYDEFYEDGTPYGGDWSKMDDIRKHLKDNNWGKTDLRIISTMYKIRYHKDMPNIKEHPEVSVVLNDVLWINFSKMPGKTYSGTSYIKEYKKHWREIVKEQIEFYDPDVLIFGNNLVDSVFNDFVEGNRTNHLGEKRQWDMHFMTIHKGHNNRLVLHTYHPGRVFSQEQASYFEDSIVEAINNHLHIKQEGRFIS